MHATLLRAYRVMPCIEQPIGWFDQCEVHGKWDNLTFSRVSSRLAADVIIFLRIASLLQPAVFLIPIPYVLSLLFP